MVIPDDGGLLSATQRIGKAGASFVEGALQPDDVVGVAWGRTVQALANNLTDQSMSSLYVVQVVGSQRGTSDGFSSEECVSLISLKLHAKTANLHTPGRPQLKRAARCVAERNNHPGTVHTHSVVQQDSLWRVLGKRQQSCFLPAGSPMQKRANITLPMEQVGVISGRFFDADGNWIQGPA